jgi:hypothetical protein
MNEAADPGRQAQLREDFFRMAASQAWASRLLPSMPGRSRQLFAGATSL